MVNKAYEDVKVVAKCVEKNIWQAHQYYLLLSKFIVNLRSTRLYNEHIVIFDYIENACRAKYILALAKIFDDTKKATLWQLLLLAKNLKDDKFELNLQFYHLLRQEDIRKKRKGLFSRFKSIENKIRKIKAKIDPLRNTEIAHEIPWISSNKNDIFVATTHKWLSFAEQTFEQCMDILDEVCLRGGSFKSKDFEIDIDECVKLIKKI